MFKRALRLLMAIPKLLLSCLKGAILILLCDILMVTFINLLNSSIPSKSVSSIQLVEPMAKLVPSTKYDYTRSVVRLFVNGQFTCTGVVIGNNYILTASHCMVDDNGEMKRALFMVSNDSGTVETMAMPVGVNTRMDWGLLRGNFSGIPGAIVVEVGFSPPTSVVACGYPQGSATLQCQITHPIINDAFLVKCRGGLIFPGQSGGPVFDGAGQVIGLNILVYPAQDGGGFAYSPSTGILASFHIADF
jgi:S1-C subfamily serine protease